MRAPITDMLGKSLLATLLACGSAAAGAQTQSTWAVDGGGSIQPTVFSSLLVPTSAGTKLWLGGNFDVVGKVTGRAAWFDSSGIVAANFPKIAASDVSAIIPQGGAWLVGGKGALDASFRYPGLLVRVLANGTLDAGLKVTLDGDVRAIATLPSGRFVIGGSFTTVDGTARSGLAMLDTTGKLLPWAPVLTGGGAVPTALSLAVQGSRIFVGGQFDSVDGQATGGLVAVDSQTGKLAWSPASTQIAVGWAIVVRGTTLYAGISGNATPANAVEAINVPSGQVTWSQGSASAPYALALGGRTLYASGGYTTTGTAPLAAFDAATGAPMPGFKPAPDQNAVVQSLLYADHLLFVGGSFGAIGGKVRHNLAALSPTSGLAAALDPAPGNAVLCLAATSLNLAAGGFFGTANAVTRTQFAEVDPVTFAPTSFAPTFNGTPTQMASDGTRVYMTGGFDVIDGARRNYAAAFDIASHSLSSFAPDATTDTSAIEALAVGTTRVYIGGDFTTIAGKPFSNLAAFDKASGAIVTGFHPTPNAPVQGLLVDANQTVYASGPFSVIAGVRRSGGAALTPAGAALAFNPNLGGLNGAPLVRLASDPVSHDLVLFGSFTSAAGLPAGNIAEVDPTTGQPRRFGASTRGTIDTVSIDPASGTIYVGGAFLPASGIVGNLAAFDQAGNTVGFAASTDGEVHTSQFLPAPTPTLDIGGAFGSVDGVSRQGVAAIVPTTGAP